MRFEEQMLSALKGSHPAPWRPGWKHSVSVRCAVEWRGQGWTERHADHGNQETKRQQQKTRAAKGLQVQGVPEAGRKAGHRQELRLHSKSVGGTQVSGPPPRLSLSFAPTQPHTQWLPGLLMSGSK